MQMMRRWALAWLLGAGLGAGGLVGHAQDAPTDLLLPPEPTDGEWLRDTLDDAALWFATSDNLGTEPVATALTEYAAGRRWLRVVDGRPAWVIYYVPGEILGFEVDTHHFGAHATDFRFSAGADFRALEPVDVWAELVEFEAQWLRLYHNGVALPPGTMFLRIEFPDGAEREHARLTEVWLRCRFADAVAAGPASPTPATVEIAPAPAGPEPSPARMLSPLLEPVIVTAWRMAAPPLEFELPGAVGIEAAPLPVVLIVEPPAPPRDALRQLQRLLPEAVPVLASTPPPPRRVLLPPSLRRYGPRGR